MSSDPVTRLNAALEGRYRIERELGEGGMATVYLAHDLKHERKVALKVLKPELAAVVGAERFLAEIKTTANLQHPHILPLFDSGAADGFLFYVMPYVEGESLRDKLDRETQLPVAEAVRLATDVAEALHAAHQQGVIHRDIKPANILLSNGRPLVADFGIALAVGASGGGRLTETGLSLGTPHYMSPEQATGDQNVGPATDIYSLGCVLYEMLVGEPPFTGSTPQAVLGKIVTAEASSARSARGSVPPNVDTVIARALAKVPADRFRSGAELARGLSDPGFGSEASTPTATSLTWWNPRSIGASLLLAAVLVLGGIFVSRVARSAGEQAPGQAPELDGASVAVLPFDNLSGLPENDAFTLGLHDDLITQISRIPDLRVIASTSMRTVEASTLTVQEIARDLRVGSVLTAGVQRSAERIRINVRLLDAATTEPIWAQQYDRTLTASDVFEIQSDIAQRVAGTLQAAVSLETLARIDGQPTQSLEAFELGLRAAAELRRPARTASVLHRADSLAREALRIDPSFARPEAVIAIAHGIGAPNMPGEGFSLDTAFAAATRSLVADELEPFGHMAMGFNTFQRTMDFEAASAWLDRAEELLPGDAGILYTRGVLAYFAHREEEALEYLERSRAADPKNANTLWEIGRVHRERRDYERARAAFTAGAEVAQGLGGRRYRGLAAETHLFQSGDIEPLAAFLEQFPPATTRDRDAFRVAYYRGDYRDAAAVAPDDLTAAKAWFMGEVSDSVNAALGRERARLEAMRDRYEVTPGETRPHDAALRIYSPLGRVYALLDLPEMAQATARRAIQVAPTAVDRFRGPDHVRAAALVAAVAGDVDGAIVLIEEYLSGPGSWMLEGLLAEPLMANVRGAPEIARLRQQFR
jgi:serine/threonine-protein kinase